MKTRSLSALVGMIAAALVTVALGAPPAAALTELTIHLSPTGSDANSGTAASPVKSIGRANEIATAKKPTDRIDVLLAPGTYTDMGDQWTYADSKKLTIRTTSGTATFDGQGTHRNYQLVIGPPASENKRIRNVILRDLRFTNATNGLQVRNTTNATLQNLKFDKIGNRWSPGSIGYAALSLQHVTDITVTNPVWTDIENNQTLDGTDTTGLVHAVYAANDADDVTLVDITATRVSGDAFRIRNGTDNFVINGGTMSSAGSRSAFSEWYNPNASTPEIRSSGSFINVTTGKNYRGETYELGRTSCVRSGSGPISDCRITDTPPS
ncbi:hypothetical protein [Parenemella sanctibonifatiensis]|uniref:DUF1565 domain-containing protein n=1 Tax=Parenemella sanctibonifatiensis TaxID=2016505 RepID=A0A255EJC1_9ACTN|nr:hypothetical protein [Parenemella sanctibonifatiensis]OYN89532.1 hypothetical protein CGZ91_11650 [Parenemella sanctibonifatiensis]